MKNTCRIGLIFLMCVLYSHSIITSAPGIVRGLPERIEQLTEVTRVLYLSEEYESYRKNPFPNSLIDYDKYRQSIIDRESGGDWKAVNNEFNRCYGIFQIQETNIRKFTGLTPKEFLNDSIAQERLFNKMNVLHYQILMKYNIESIPLDSLLFKSFTR